MGGRTEIKSEILNNGIIILPDLWDGKWLGKSNRTTDRTVGGIMSVWGQEIIFYLVFLVCSFYLARLEDMAKRRTLLENERLSSKIN